MATGLDAVAVFVSVVEAGSFTKAALATGVPRSTVSARVAELEARLGVALLRRTTRRLQLTEAGRDYFDSVRQSLQQIAAAELALKSNQSEARGRLRIAAATNMGEGVIGDAIADFLAAYPHIEIELELGQRRVELIAEQYDLAIRLGELEETSSLVARRIGTIARQLMASPVYAADRAISHPRDINPREIIGFAGEQAIELLHEGGERYLLECRGRLQVNRMTAIRHQARRGAGIALLPTAFTIDSTAASRLVVVLPQWRTHDIPVHLVYPRQHALPYRTRLFIDHLVEALRPAG